MMKYPSLIPDKVKTWDYYLKKLPLYLQNSYGFNDHFYILYELLYQIETASVELLRGLDLFDETKQQNSDTYINYLKQFTNDEYVFDLLDKIATIYNVNRKFDVTYIISDTSSEDFGKEKTYTLELTNKELLILILTKSILSAFDGTYYSARELYDKIKLPIYIYTQDATNVKLILDTSITENPDESDIIVITENIKHMFNAGLFTLNSMGVNYTTETLKISTLAKWDESKWDEGVLL